MHKVFKIGHAPKDYHFEEYCPHCDNPIPVLIDEKEFNEYETVCPECGHRLMLCTLCHDDLGQACDWDAPSHPKMCRFYHECRGCSNG